ncbi:hypothetical protein GEMRC1_011955 [Eukaryota sp. GEM-RC1]
MRAEDQMKVFKNTPANTRKVIVATNIAETSLTIPGVVYVIDCGLHKQRTFHPSTGIDILRVDPVSKAGLTQRKGRAGREAPGKCFRLFEEKVIDEMIEVDVPEILRTDLSSTFLNLLVIGVNLFKMELLAKPDDQALRQAVKVLQSMKAIKKGRDGVNYTLTDLGKQMSLFPISVQLSRALIVAADRSVLDQVAMIISLMTSEHVFMDNQSKSGQSFSRFTDISGDHCMLLKLFREYLADVKPNLEKIPGRRFELNRKKRRKSTSWCRKNNISWKAMRHALDVYLQLIDYCRKANLSVSSMELTADVETMEIRKSLIAGYFLRIASLSEDRRTYQTLSKHQECFLHPMSVLALNPRSKPQFVLYSELVSTTKVYMRTVSEIEESWIEEVVPGFNLH